MQKLYCSLFIDLNKQNEIICNIIQYAKSHSSNLLLLSEPAHVREGCGGSSSRL